MTEPNVRVRARLKQPDGVRDVAAHERSAERFVDITRGSRDRVDSEHGHKH